MSEVNKGLNKLGLSLYTQNKPFARFQNTIPVSEKDQIDEIMAQAKDETNVLFSHECTGSNQSNITAKEEEEEICDDSDDDDDGEEDELLDDDLLSMKLIQKKVAKAQGKLSELLAILDEAQTMKVKEDIDEDEEKYLRDDDDDDYDDELFTNDIEKANSTAMLITGKNKLKKAQRDMRKALVEFENVISL